MQDQLYLVSKQSARSASNKERNNNRRKKKAYKNKSKSTQEHKPCLLRVQSTGCGRANNDEAGRTNWTGTENGLAHATFRRNSLSPLEYVLNTSKCCKEAMPFKVILTSLCL